MVWQSAALKTQVVIWGGTRSRAVEDVERDRAGGDFGLEALQAVGAADVCRLDRLLADNVDDTALRGVGYAFAGKLQFVDGRHRVVAGNLQEPRLAVEHERAPGEACDPRSRASLDALGAGPHFRRRSARAPVLRGRDFRPLGLGGSGAGEHQLRAGLACREGRGEEPANQGAEASTSLAKCRGAGEKGEGARGLARIGMRSSKLEEFRRLRALRAQNAPPIYAPTGRFGLEKCAELTEFGVERWGPEDVSRRL